MKRHTDALLHDRDPDDSRLTRDQRHRFVAGWLLQIVDGPNISFTLGTLFWSAAMIITPKHIGPPLLIFAILPLVLFVFKVGKAPFFYRYTADVDLCNPLLTTLAGLSLSHAITKAVLCGSVTCGVLFFRMPEMRSNYDLLVILAEAHEEVLVMLLLQDAATDIVTTQGVPSCDLLIWAVMLLVQSLPHLATLAMALSSSLPKPRGGLVGDAKWIGG